jgi:hypothetical protein
MRTENYVDPGNGMYAMVLKTVHEMGSWEDIMSDSTSQTPYGGSVGLYFSRAGDVWGDTLDQGCVGKQCAAMVNPGVGGKGKPRAAFSPHKKAVYIMLRHLGLVVDVIVEEDLADGTIDSYSLLAVTDRHLSQNATRNIGQWVGTKAGTLLCTGGACAMDEFDEPLTGMSELLGVRETELLLDDPTMPIQYMKQDLPYATALESVHSVVSTGEQESKPMPVFGAISVANVSVGLTTTMAFSNGSAAATERAVGRGHAVWLGFLPGLSYFKTALPRRPVDRCFRNDCYCQFLPEQFDAAALAVLQHVQELASASKPIFRPLSASDGLVEVSPVVTASAGSLFTLVNWRMTPTAVTILVDNTTGWLAEFDMATLGSSNQAVPRTVAGKKIALGPVDVAVADVIVLR